MELFGNNKGTLEGWLYFLTKSHTFARLGRVEKTHTKPRYILKLEGVSDEAKKWINDNFNPLKKAPMNLSVGKWKKPLPKVVIDTTMKWQVRVNLELVFEGDEADARERFEAAKLQPKTNLVSIRMSDYSNYQDWKRPS